MNDALINAQFPLRGDAGLNSLKFLCNLIAPDLRKLRVAVTSNTERQTRWIRAPPRTMNGRWKAAQVLITLGWKPRTLLRSQTAKEWIARAADPIPVMEDQGMRYTASASCDSIRTGCKWCETRSSSLFFYACSRSWKDPSSLVR